MSRRAASETMLDKADVQIRELPYRECDDCICEAEVEVVIDFRSAGQTSGVGVFCRDCGDEIVKRIRDGLPAPPAQGEGAEP